MPGVTRGAGPDRERWLHIVVVVVPVLVLLTLLVLAPSGVAWPTRMLVAIVATALYEFAIWTRSTRD